MLRDSWAKDTKVNGVEFSSFIFIVAECQRKSSNKLCTNDDFTTKAPPTIAPPPPGKECILNSLCCSSRGMFASIAVQCMFILLGTERKGYCNVGACVEPSGCNEVLRFSIGEIMLNAFCGMLSMNSCRVKCKATINICYDSGRWNNGIFFS